MKHTLESKRVHAGSASVMAAAIGALAIGAFAIGALAIGRLVIGKMKIGKAKLKSLEIGELKVKQLHVSNLTVSDSLQLPRECHGTKVNWNERHIQAHNWNNRQAGLDAMTTARRNFAFFLLFLQFPVYAAARAQTPLGRKAVADSASSVFEPLDVWKAAVLAGDRNTLAALYTTTPPSQSKIPQGQTQDPAEEPAFWSQLRGAGLNRLDVKILEIRDLQPGVKSLVLRLDAGLHTPGGEKSGIVSVSQVWLERRGEWQIVATQRSDLVQKPVMRLPEPARPNTQLYPDPAVASGDITAALASATRDHKRVLLVFGGNWCYDCHVLDASFHSRAILPLINENYHVVHVNVGDYDKNLDLAKKYEIPLEKGVPSLAILDPSGKLLVSQKKGEFESTVRIGPEDVVRFLQQWKPNRNGS